MVHYTNTKKTLTFYLDIALILAKIISTQVKIEFLFNVIIF